MLGDYVIQFFLKFENLLLTFPVNPEELEVNKTIAYDTYGNLDKKGILKLQEDQLLELEFTSILEQEISALSVTGEAYASLTYLDYFNQLKDHRNLVRVTSSDGVFDFMGYIVGITTSYTGGDLDYGYTLSIVENRQVELVANIDNDYAKIETEYVILRDTATKNPTVQNTNNSNTNPSASNYTVVSGDTLSGIARKYYGNSNRWVDIFNANRNVISNANLIYPGQVLTIP